MLNGLSLDSIVAALADAVADRVAQRLAQAGNGAANCMDARQR